MKHPFIIIFSIIYFLTLFFKVPLLTHLLILPATILFVFGYTILQFLFYSIFFLFSLLIGIFTADGERFFFSFFMYLSNLWKTIKLKDKADLYQNLFYEGTFLGITVYILVGLIIGLYFLFYIFNDGWKDLGPKDLTKPDKRKKDKISTKVNNKLNKFLNDLRNKHTEHYVPGFDPNDGGANAEIMLLFEKPGPMTDPRNGGSGLISIDNNDETARSTKLFLNKAGIDRKKIIIWNVISFWNGTIKIKKEDEFAHAVNELTELLKITKKIKTIILVGKSAQNISKKMNLKDYKIIKSMHPSPRNRASRRDAWEDIPNVWKKALEDS